MLRATFTSLLARKARLLLSAMAIILGTAFVAGSLIFTDTLGRTFDGVVESTVGDVAVQPPQQSAQGPGGATGAGGQLPADEVAAFADLPGAARADGLVQALGVFVVGDNGQVVGGQGAPAFAYGWTQAPNQLGEPLLSIVEGREPRAEDEVAIDTKTAERAGKSVGDTVEIVTTGEYPRVKATIVGTVRFGESTAGASITVFDTATMQKYFLGGKDAYSTVWVTAKDGVSQQDLLAEVQPRVPKGFEAQTGAKIAEDSADQIQQALSFVTTFLLIFAGIALFVGSFLIINTFSILVAQRSRELALLRAIGASRRQVTRTVLLEAFIVGLVGATLGLALGVLLAIGIQALFSVVGLDLSGTGLIFRPRTVIAVYAVGLLVTMLAAWLPARRAGRVPPVAAMRDAADSTGGSHPIRTAVEVGILVLGVLAFLIGLFVVEERQLWWIGAGVTGLVLGTAFLAPFVGRPVIATLGATYRRLYGPVGHMAEQNAVRSPGRTAATASALMIGMTLVALMGVLSASAQASIDKQIDETFRADYLLSNAIGQPFSASLTEQAAKVDGVASASPVRWISATTDGTTLFTSAIDPATFGDVEQIQLTEGSGLTDDGVLMRENHAEGRSVGDKVTVSIGSKTRSLPILGFYEELTVSPSSEVLLSVATATAMGAPKADNQAFITLDPGADRTRVEEGLEKIVADQPLVTVKDQEGYADEQRSSINQILYLIYALLGLAILIAVLGIVNTLGLSVMERTREIGLLRAVGLARSQLRRMIRLEAVTIALLGALLGIVLGVISGVAIQRSLVEDGFTVLAIPWGSLLLFVVLAGLVGVLAAVLPARRAAKMDILTAISTE